MTFQRVLVYNASFDYNMLKYTAKRYGYQLPDEHTIGGGWECLMEEVARYNGDWSRYWHGWTWCTLDAACAQFGIERGDASHRALADASGARHVLHALADLHDSIVFDAALPRSQLDDAMEDADLGKHPF